MFRQTGNLESAAAWKMGRRELGNVDSSLDCAESQCFEDFRHGGGGGMCRDAVQASSPSYCAVRSIVYEGSRRLWFNLTSA